MTSSGWSGAAARRDLDPQRQAGLPVGPDVDAPDRRVRVPRDEPQPVGGPAGDAAGRQRADRVVGDAPEQAPAQLGREQVGGAGQAQRGAPGELRELIEPEVPDVLAAVRAVGVALADRRELVGAPAVGPGDEPADPGDAGEQRGRRLQRGQFRQGDAPGRLREPDPRLCGAREDPPPQPGGTGPVGRAALEPGQRVDGRGGPGQREGAGRDQQPAPAEPCGRHAAPRCHRLCVPDCFPASRQESVRECW